MKCDDARELAFELLDAERPSAVASTDGAPTGVAPRDVARALAEHLEQCAECREHVRLARRLAVALRARSAPELDDAEVANAARAITRAVTLSTARRRTRRRLAWSAAAAAVLLAAFLWSRHAAPERAPESPIASPEAPHVVPARPESTPEAAPAFTAPLEPRAPRSESVAVDAPLAPNSESVAVDAPLAVEVDPELVAERERLRSAFAASELAPLAFRAEVEAFAAAMETGGEFARAGTDAGLRRVEGLLRDADVAIATRAARYVGLRGDRRSLGALARSSAPRTELALAHLDLSGAAPEALTLALAEPAGRRELLERAAERGVAPLALVEALAGSRDVQPDAWERVLARATANDLAACLSLAPVDELARALAERPELGAELAACAARARGEQVDAWLELFARAPATDAAPWLVEMLADRRQRESALAALQALPGDAGLDELLAEAARSRSRRADLVAVLRARAEREPAALRSFAERLARASDDTRTELLLEALIETESAGASPALVALALRVDLPPETRLLALEAVREHASADAAVELADGFARFTRRERRLAAVALLAIQRHGGDAALETALAGFAETERRPIRELVARRATTSANTVQLARLLEARLPEQARYHFDLRFSS